MSFGHGVADIARIEAERDTVRLIADLVRALDPQYVIETGCYHGTTSAAIGEALINGHLTTMDTDAYSVDLTRSNVVGLPVDVRHCSSLDFIPTRPVDLAFLDSGIGDLRLREMAHFRQYIAPEGLVLMHDARELWEPQDGWRWVKLPTPRGLLVAQAA